MKPEKGKVICLHLARQKVFRTPFLWSLWSIPQRCYECFVAALPLRVKTTKNMLAEVQRHQFWANPGNLDLWRLWPWEDLWAERVLSLLVRNVWCKPVVFIRGPFCHSSLGQLPVRIEPLNLLTRVSEPTNVTEWLGAAFQFGAARSGFPA